MEVLGVISFCFPLPIFGEGDGVGWMDLFVWWMLTFAMLVLANFDECEQYGWHVCIRGLLLYSAEL